MSSNKKNWEMSSKPSTLKRASSSSSIPVLFRPSSVSSTSGPSTNGPSRHSRPSIRKSVLENRGKSMGRVTQGKKSLDRIVRSSSHTNLSYLPGFSRQRSGSLVRRTGSMLTPLNQLSDRPLRKSPLLSSDRKDHRPITDKRWQYEEIVKIRNFVVAKLPHLIHDVNNIKSGIPLDLFVELMASYFKLIDKRINITRANYLEEVPSSLKRCRYSASVKPSLMKTVNTPHSWPHVLAILSWLTEVVNATYFATESPSYNRTLADRCVLDWYAEWNRCQDDAAAGEIPLARLEAELAKESGITDEKMNSLNQEVEELHLKLAAYTKKKEEKIQKNEEIRRKISTLTKNREDYETQTEEFVKKMTSQQAKLTAKIKLIDQELDELQKTDDHLKSVTAAQQHSRIEEQALAAAVQGLKNTVNLMSERLQQQIELITSYDFKLADSKYKLEADAYTYNNIINQLKIANPELKKLHVREKGFSSSDTHFELTHAVELLRETIAQLRQDSMTVDKELEESAKKDKQISEELTRTKNEIEQLSTREAELLLTLEHTTKKYALNMESKTAEVNTLEKILAELRASKPDLALLDDEMQQLQTKKDMYTKHIQDLKETALVFFVKLEALMMKNLEKYMEVLEELDEGFKAILQQAIIDSQSRLQELRKVREEMEGSGPS